MRLVEKRGGTGFTIVELLVVIVVIGILAAVTIISYTGVTQKAITASIQSDLTNASNLLKLDQVTNGTYPTTLAAANNGKGIQSSPNTTYQYVYDNGSTPQLFCLSATNGTISYKVTNDGSPVAGDCQNYGLVLDLDPGNTASYPPPFSGVTINDLSGNGNNGVLTNGPLYNAANQGIIYYDGVDDYITAGNSTSLQMTRGSVSAWVKTANAGTGYRGIAGNLGSYTMYLANNIFGIYDNSVGVFRSTGVNLANNQWHYVVATFSSGVTNGTNLYIDGSLSLTTTLTYNGYTSFRIGIGQGGASQIINGYIGDVRAYSRYLPAAEIQQNFEGQKSRYGL